MTQKTKRRTKSGVVLKLSSANTVSVLVETLTQHDKYKKVYRTSRKYLVHVNDGQEVSVGDKVEIVSCRPLSKNKSWRLLSITGNEDK